MSLSPERLRQVQLLVLFLIRCETLLLYVFITVRIITNPNYHNRFHKRIRMKPVYI